MAGNFGQLHRGKMHQTKPLILLLLLALMSCNNIQQEQRFLPENCFEGDFLPIGKAIIIIIHKS